MFSLITEPVCDIVLYQNTLVCSSTLLPNLSWWKMSRHFRELWLCCYHWDPSIIVLQVPACLVSCNSMNFMLAIILKHFHLNLTFDCSGHKLLLHGGSLILLFSYSDNIQNKIPRMFTRLRLGLVSILLVC